MGAEIFQIETGDKVKSIDSFSLNGADLTLSFTTKREGVKTVTQSLFSFQEAEIKDNVENYDELLTILNPVTNQFAYVRNSQGVKWQSNIGIGKYYGSGLYMWNGLEWTEDDSDIFNQLEVIISNLNLEIQQRIGSDLLLQENIDKNSLRLLDSEVVVKQASDFPSTIDGSKVYVIDGKIDMGNTSIIVGPEGFFYRGSDYFISSLFSNEDNYTMFINESGSLSGNVRGTNIEHYVSGLNSKIFNLDNQENFGAIEFNSCNFGRFASLTTSLGELSNYRQFRTNDCGFFRISDGLVFNGVWNGGFRIGDSILLNIPDNVTLFKEGTNLIFNGSSFTDLNAIGVTNSSSVFGFTENNFSLDEGFIMDDVRFNINSIPMPNADLSSSKFNFKGRGIQDTFPGGRWEITTEILTPLTFNVKTKLLGVTSYADLVHYNKTEDNSFIYDSSIIEDFVVEGQIIIDGGPNDEIELFVDRFDFLTGSFITERSFIRIISNVVGGRDIAYFNIYAPFKTRSKFDRIEIYIRNNSDNSNAKGLAGSFLAINVRN